MTAQPNIGGALCESFVISFRVPRPGDGQRSCKVRLASAERRRCSNEAKTRNPLKFAGVPQTNEPILAAIVGRSSPYCENMRGRYCCLTNFSPIVDVCLSCEDIARQSCAMVSRWRILSIFLRPVFQQAACSTFQTCILNSH